MGRLRIAGAYMAPAAVNYPSRTASEHGRGIVGLYSTSSAEQMTVITIHDCESPARPLATVGLPWATTGGEGSSTARQTSYLGAGRAVVVMANTAVYGTASAGMTLLCVTYRNGALDVGKPLITRVADVVIEGVGVTPSEISNVVIYAMSGSRFRIIASFGASTVATAEFTAEPSGNIVRSTPWTLAPVVIGMGYDHIPFLVRGGSLFTFGDRIRRYDAATLELEATSTFGPPANVPQFGYGSRDRFGVPNFGPDGKIEIFEIELRESPSYPDYVKSVKAWHVDPATLERTVEELSPPHSAGSASMVPEFSDKIWNIQFPPVGPGYAYALPTGDMRSSMGGLLVAYGRSKTQGGSSTAGDWGDSAAGLLHTGEWVAEITIAPPGGIGVTNSPEGIFFTRDNYAISLDPGSKGRVAVFFATAPVLPPDTLAELASYKQGYFS